MFKQWMVGVAAFVAPVVMANVAAAQFADRDSQADHKIDPGTRTRVIDGVLKQLNDGYVFPQIAKKMEDTVRARVANHEYDDITSARKLAQTLTSHLRQVSHDRHIRVEYSLETLPPESSAKEPRPEEVEKMRRFLGARNFGFEKVERLQGNIGYLDMRFFAPADLAGDTVAGAMGFLANTDALIIDLRENGGGSPGMVALVCSYLFPAGSPVHLNDLYFRPDNSTHQWWTLPYLPGKRYADKSVYVLTSRHTFSGAEECAYNLKNLKRATIVGETTGGGAHPGGQQRVDDHFAVFVPVGRAINPITKTNWEGTGVQPDVAVAAGLALKTAYLAAIDKVTPLHKDKEELAHFKKLREHVQEELDKLKSQKAVPAASP